MTEIISSYGLHWVGDIPFLVQPSGAQNLISPDLPSPLVPQIRAKRVKCPHNINLSVTVPLPDWIHDPLVRAFLPLPRQKSDKAQLILDPESKAVDMVQTLSRLSSAVHPLAYPIWFRDTNEGVTYYSVTNLSPMVWLGCEQIYARAVLKHIQLARSFNRRCLFIAPQRIGVFDDCEWIKSDFPDLRNEPLEAIGAQALKEYMQSERQA